MGKLEGKCAIVTGAASGIGRSSAVRFAAEGAAVMCADVDLEGAKHTAALIAEAGGASAALDLDVSDAKAVEAALISTERELGGLHVLFNNAGIGGTTTSWDDVIRINQQGVYNGLYYGCRMLAERGGGAVVNTASIAGLVALITPMTGDPKAPEMEYGSGAYQASKAAVIELTRQFAVAYATRGVRVNAVAPGYIVTPMTAMLREAPSWEKYLISLHPMNRLGQPDEIAAAAAFLASDDASFVTGITLPVDGGYTSR